MKLDEVPYISDGNSRFPFSRGILAKSLTYIGLEIELSYEIARLVGEELQKEERQDVQLKELKDIVCRILRAELSVDIADSYRLQTQLRQQVLVVSGEGGKTPYSRWIIAQTLKSSGISVVNAAQAAKDIKYNLIREGISEISRPQLRQRVADHLAACYGDDHAKKYLIAREIRAKVSPVIILIGGSTGSGKSTIARKLAARFEIGRFVSTDIIRQVMRTIFTAEMMPFIHRSSYNVYEELDIPIANVSEKVIVAFREQARQVMVGINALVGRVLEENLDVILEGVHIVPGMLHEKYVNHPNICSFVIVTSNEQEHRSHFGHRQAEANQRRAERYLKHFASIRRIQYFLMDRAAEYQIPIVNNVNLDQSIPQAAQLVTDHLIKSIGKED